VQQLRIKPGIPLEAPVEIVAEPMVMIEFIDQFE